MKVFNRKDVRLAQVPEPGSPGGGFGGPPPTAGDLNVPNITVKIPSAVMQKFIADVNADFASDQEALTMDVETVLDTIKDHNILDLSELHPGAAEAVLEEMVWG